MIEEFGLGSFEVLANSLERTFCDKCSRYATTISRAPFRIASRAIYMT